MILKRLIGLIRQKASKNQYYLEIGTYLLRKGAKYKVGDSVLITQRKRGIPTKKKVYIANLWFDFAKNKITHQFTEKKPIIK